MFWIALQLSVVEYLGVLNANYENVEHVGRLARMSTLDTNVDGSIPASICFLLEQETLSALLQSTQL